MKLEEMSVSSEVFQVKGTVRKNHRDRHGKRQEGERSGVEPGELFLPKHFVEKCRFGTHESASELFQWAEETMKKYSKEAETFHTNFSE